MDTVKFVPMLVGLLLAVVMVGAVFVPVISSSTSRTITTEIENEGAGWLKLGYSTNDYEFTITSDETHDIVIGSQVGNFGNMIYYADGENAIFSDDSALYLISSDRVFTLTNDVTVSRSNGVTTFTDGENVILTDTATSGAYIPDSAGMYGFFDTPGLNLNPTVPTVAIGTFAGAYAYNDRVIASYGQNVPLAISGGYGVDDTGVSWVIPSENETLNLTPLDLDLQPLDLSKQVGLMSVNPTTYVDDSGLWGFEIISSGLHAGKLNVGAYLGNSTDLLVVPSVLYKDGVAYTVRNLTYNGTGSVYPIIPTGVVIGTLVISEGIYGTGIASFKGCHIENIVFPESFQVFPTDAFMNNKYLSGDVYIGPTISQLYKAFGSVGTNVGGLHGLIDCHKSGTFLTPFENVQVSEFLKLNDIPIEDYGLTADTVQDSFDALGYVAPTSIRETEVIPIDSPAADLMQLLPLIAGIGALFLAVGTMIYTRF